MNCPTTSMYSETPDNFPGNPVMVYGIDESGDFISSDIVESKLGDPNDPFPTGNL